MQHPVLNPLTCSWLALVGGGSRNSYLLRRSLAILLCLLSLLTLSLAIIFLSAFLDPAAFPHSHSGRHSRQDYLDHSELLLDLRLLNLHVLHPRVAR